ncbi:zinc finger BED domain-containing protein RICESLEEPER 2 isoform X1 [Lolium perenne]|uniref:zinc finger BED domain-containing protein RICESLEEPER 2 isoform X1 n=1 Tax=Lolium perenne TaxID=4522 RepID=UPI0021F609AC|nr:zinc finger BED domain-containing protein RICESLEEPER 2-like isoform X1 [Lolium perenne]XP_051201149.1 zinc finger BED domain-containing protein RICESLEEPER 2-like isoform X1 [Lolium perenne]
MEHDEHDSDDDVPPGLDSDGDASRFRKKRSKVWEEYTPVYVNGVIQSAECRYCRTLMSCKGAEGRSNGTSHLWRHHKNCRAKGGVDPSELQDTDFPYVGVNDIDPVNMVLPESLDDINLVNVSENSRYKSKVWMDFTPVYVEGRIQGADCIHCHKRFSAEGRSHLNRHTQSCSARVGTSANHQDSWFFASSVQSRVKDELSPALTNGKVQIAEYASRLLKGNSSGHRNHQNQHILALPADSMTPTEPSNLSALTRKLDQEACYQDLTRMIVMHGYPLSIVEHEEMKRFAKGLNPMFNMASSLDMEEYSTLLFQKEKSDLKEKIALSSQRISLSASVWFPHGAEPTIKYLCLTAHFIDADWKLQRRIIKFGVFWSSPSNLERIIHYKEACVLECEIGACNVIWEAIRDWNLDRKLFCLASVSEIRNDESISKLKDMLMQRNSLPIRGQLYNIACVDDVLNSVILQGQQMLYLVGDLLERFIQACVSSSLTRQQLLEVVSHVGLKCPHEDSKWWHKIYFRLEVLLHYKKSFPSEELVSLDEMKIVEPICKILRVFYRVIEVISGSVCLTANMYFHEVWKVRTILQEEASTEHTDVASMVREMQEAFNEYWQNSYFWLSVPVVLDPRFKITFIEFRLKRAFGADAAKYVNDVTEITRELFHEYCTSMDQSNIQTSNCQAHDVEMYGFDSDSLEDWDQHLTAQTRSQLLSELDNYLEDGLVPRKDDFDILNWWMSHSSKYPTLSIMAQDVLAMPCSAVHCDAAFSSRGPVIHKQWSTLNIKTIEALVCTRDWIR